MLKAFILFALIYLFVRMLLNYKASLSTMKTWKQKHHSFMHDFDLFTPNENSFGSHQDCQGIEINPTTGLPMWGVLISAVTLMELIYTTVTAVMVLTLAEGLAMMTKAKRIARVLLLIDVIVFGSGALYALIINTYGG
jgi:hypothetical protein